MFFLKTISVFCVAALLLAFLADLVVWSVTMVVGGIGIWAKSPNQLLTLLTTFLSSYGQARWQWAGLPLES